MFVLSTSSLKREAPEDVMTARISVTDVTGMTATTATMGDMQAEEMGQEMPGMEGMDRNAITEVMDRILKPQLR